MFISKDPRFKLTPQIRTYDKIDIKWHPNIMFFQEENFSSAVINTDQFGFRYTSNKSSKISPCSDSKIFDQNTSLIIGSSSAFGVGASSDQKTISSLLTKYSKEKYLNFGGRAHVSSQELTLFNQFASKFKKIKNVIIFSGLNDLYLSYLRNDFNELAPFFYGKQYVKNMENVDISFKRQIIKFFLYPFYKNSINYKKLSLEELLKLKYRKHKQYNQNRNIKKSYSVDYTIEHLERNLFIWKKLSQSFPFNLIYVLQPTLEWMPKLPSKEENIIIKYLNTEKDRIKVNNILSKSVHEEYSLKLRRVCKKLNIRYFDSNYGFSKNINNDDWLFVDRVHMTDKGYSLISIYLNEIIKKL